MMNTYEPSIFRAYDMRGIYPSQMNEKVAYAAGQAFVSVTGARTVAVGRDVRSTGESLERALIQGVMDAGANVIEIGVISTEMMYYAAGMLDCDGGMTLTASHNPAEWNGIKFIGKGALPLTKEGDLGKIYEFIQSGRELKQFNPGELHMRDIRSDYVAYLEKFVPKNLRALKLVVNVNFGANGKVIDEAVKNLPLTLVRLNWNEDGTFPKGTPDPLLPKNRKELSERIVTEAADFGVAFDADADRAFFYDEKGRAFPGYYIETRLAEHFLNLEPGAGIAYDPRLTWAVEAAVQRGQGRPYITRTGHGYFKQSLRENGAVFGGENSGHFYYRDFFCCDSGLLTFLLVMGIFNEQILANSKVSEILDQYQNSYPASDELNYFTDRAKEIVEETKSKYSDATITSLDGTSVEYLDYRFNLRLSNNEPVLRLNLEAKTPDGLARHLAEVQAFITGFGAKLRNDE